MASEEIFQQRFDRLEGLIADLAATRRAEVEAELISPEEARKFFSPAITKLTLRNWTDKKFIPVQKIGGKDILPPSGSACGGD